jgi:hypothetical protein
MPTGLFIEHGTMPCAHTCNVADAIQTARVLHNVGASLRAVGGRFVEGLHKAQGGIAEKAEVIRDRAMDTKDNLNRTVINVREKASQVANIARGVAGTINLIWENNQEYRSRDAHLRRFPPPPPPTH